MAAGETLIVGAGPTGLTLAIELARFGLPYRIVDKATEPARWSQALAVQARTLEQFDRYGIADAAVDRGRPLHRVIFRSNGTEIGRVDLDRIRSRFAFVLALPQSETERLLIDHLASLGGHVERGTTLAGFRQDAEGVEGTLDPPDGLLCTERFDWIVGCDGAHSVVRRDLGVGFEGDTVPISFFLADVELQGSDVPGDEIVVDVRGGDLVFYGRLTERLWRLIVALHEHQEDDRAPKTADFQAAIDRCTERNIRVGRSVWMARFRINQRKAERYRVNRAFLAGDAAHIHSPVAGQGMNSGIQDAANLAWKLAAVVAGANPTLLDSYDDERGAVGKALLARTSAGLAAVTTADSLAIAARDAIAPIASRLGFVQDRLTGFASETDIAYRDSPIVRDPDGRSPLHAGERAPDVTLLDPTAGRISLLAYLREPRHLVLAVDVDDVAAFADRYRATFLALQTRLPASPILDERSVTPLDHDAFAHAYGVGPCIYVLRPDGYIGYRGEPAATLALDAYARTVGIERSA